MAGLLDFLQAASNSAASNVSGPVDGLAWLLRKAGIDVGEPVGGSAWMERQGLTRPVKQSGASLAGETAGLLAPIAAAAKAPQIAKGLLQMGENAAAPRSAGMAASQRGAFIFPREEAMKTAQKNAEEMLGLPPNNTAAERAAALGFDDGWFHGTPSDALPKSRQFKNEKLGSATRVSDARKGHFLVDDGRAASEYTYADGEMVGNVLPLMTRGRYGVADTPGEWMPGKFDAAIDAARAAGQDGVVLRGTTTLGKRGDYKVAFDPTKIRSRFAAFDPARLNEPDLLATLAAMGIGLPALAGLMKGEAE